MIDYRGYGKSTGRNSSQAQLHADVRKAWDSIAPQYADKPIIIYGRSLGAALAAEEIFGRPFFLFTAIVIR